MLTFEFPHLLNLIEKVQFDTIYHEHFSYLSLLSVEPILRSRGLLRSFDVELIPTHGGSLRLFCGHVHSGHQETRALAAVRDDKNPHSRKLDRLETYRGFAPRVKSVGPEVFEIILQVRCPRGGALQPMAPLPRATHS